MVCSGEKWLKADPWLHYKRFKILRTKGHQEIIAKTEKLIEHPEIGRIVPEVSDQNVRELIVYSYRLVYEISAGRIQILAVIHGKRDFNSAWDERDH